MLPLITTLSLVAFVAAAQPVKSPPPSTPSGEAKGSTQQGAKETGDAGVAEPGARRRLERYEDMTSRMAWEVLDPSKPLGAHPASVTTDRSTPRVIAFQSAPSEIAAEALSIVAEIAMDRAKKGALEVVHHQLQTSVCSLPAPAQAAGVDGGVADAGAYARALPDTCDLIGATTLETLIANPDPLFIALAQDFASLSADYGWTGAIDAEVLREVLKVCARIVADAVARQQATFTTESSWLVASTVLDQLANSATISDPANGNGDLLVALRTAKACLLAVKQEPTYVCDVHDLTGAVLAAFADGGVPLQPDGGTTLAAAQRIDAERFANLAIRASLAVTVPAHKEDPVPDPRERLRAGVSLSYRVAQTVVKRSKHPEEDKKVALKQLELQEATLTAAIDGNQPQMIASGAELVLNVLANAPDLTPPDENVVRKASAMLTAIARYSSTFNKIYAADSEDLAPVREARKKVLEELISSTTIRSGRANQWVWSLGAPVGLTTGWQWIQSVSPPGSPTPPAASAGTGFMPPQLGLGIGIAAQLLPDKCCGIHLGATALDLGQFTAYDKTRVTTPQWDTVLSPGIQVGFLLTGPEHTLLVALDGRYPPGILASQAEDGSRTRGALRVGITFAYYVPLFDFN